MAMMLKPMCRCSEWMGREFLWLQKNSLKSMKHQGGAGEVFFKALCIIIFAPRGQIVYKEFYIDVLKCLRIAVHMNRPEV